MMFFAWVLALGLVQGVIFMGVQINFLALLAVFAGFRKGPLAGFLLGGVAGVMAEAMSSSEFGLNIGLYSAIGLLAGIIKSGVYYKENIFTEIVFSFFGVVFFYAAYFLFSSVMQKGMFFTALFSAMTAPLLFRMIEPHHNQA